MTGKQWLYRWGVPPPSNVNQSAYNAIYLTLMEALDGQGEGADGEMSTNDDPSEFAEQLCGEFVAAAEHIRKLIGNARYKEAQQEGIDNASYSCSNSLRL